MQIRQLATTTDRHRTPEGCSNPREHSQGYSVALRGVWLQYRRHDRLDSTSLRIDRAPNVKCRFMRVRTLTPPNTHLADVHILRVSAVDQSRRVLSESVLLQISGVRSMSQFPGVHFLSFSHTWVTQCLPYGRTNIAVG